MEDGLDHGLEEARSATCHHGRDLDGCLGVDGVGGCGATRIILGFGLAFRGFQDGGHIHIMDTPTGFQRLIYHIDGV